MESEPSTIAFPDIWAGLILFAAGMALLFILTLLNWGRERVTEWWTRRRWRQDKKLPNPITGRGKGE